LGRFTQRGDDGAILKLLAGDIDTVRGRVYLLQKPRTCSQRPDEVRGRCGGWQVAAGRCGVVGVKRGIDGSDVAGVGVKYPDVAAGRIVLGDEIAGDAAVSESSMLMVFCCYMTASGAHRTLTPAALR